jgi:hypothetical protein
MHVSYDDRILKSKCSGTDFAIYADGSCYVLAENGVFPCLIRHASFCCLGDVQALEAEAC